MNASPLPFALAESPPPGWPTVAEEVARLWAEAVSLAELGRSGFVGIEHLAVALCATTAGGPATRKAREAVRAMIPALEEGLQRLQRTPEVTESPPCCTLRLLSYGAQLPKGATLDALWTLIARDPTHRLAGLDLAVPPEPVVGADAEDAWISSGGYLDPATALVVASGPEDGRVLLMRPGQSLGRWNSGGPHPDHALYQGALAIDDRLSRIHLTWLGTGRVLIERKGVGLTRWSEQRPLPAGTQIICRGDLLLLTHATALRGIASRVVR